MAIASGVLGTGGASAAIAQQQVLEEIVVTAQKREQAITDVGMSIHALDESELKARHIDSVADLARVVPGFTFTRTQFDEPVYSLRGVGYVESSLAANPAVSVYLDEVPLPYPSMTRGALLDLERVEVLKGPQGTLYGQNSTGGAVNYIAAHPGASFEGGLNARYGRFGSYGADGYVSGPISDRLGARLAVKSVQGGSWQRSLTRDDDLGDRDELVARLIVDFAPTDSLAISVNVNGWRDRSETQAPQHRGVFLAVPGNPIPDGFMETPLAPHRARAADWDAGRPFRRDSDFYQVSLRGDIDVTDSATVTAISAFQRLDRDATSEVDGTPFEDLLIRTLGGIESFVQELRLSGEASRLHWVVGANYQSDDIEDRQFIELDASTSASVGPFHFPEFLNVSSNDVTTWAAFAGGEYSLTDNVGVEAGVRYTNSNNDYESCTRDAGDGSLAALFAFLQSFAPTPPATMPVAGGCVTIVGPALDVGSVAQTLDEDNVSWRLALNWHPAEDVLVYGNVSQGYKAGNFPTLSASSFAQLFAVTQEKLLATEVGFKATFVGSAMQLNGAAFYYDYRDKQLRGRVSDPIFGQLEALLNIPDSHVAGAELQWMASPLPGLWTNVGVNYVHSEVDGGFVNYTQFGALEDFGGNDFPYSPEWQLVADVAYERPAMWSGVDWFVGASTTYHSSTKGGLEDDPRLTIDSYTLIDLRVGIKGADDSWSLSVWGQNVGDEYYLVNVLKAQDNVIGYAGQPATYGVSFGVAF